MEGCARKYEKASREMEKMQGNHFVSPSQHVVSLLWRLTDKGRTFKFVADITMISIISIIIEHLASPSASSTVKTFSSLHSHYHHHCHRHCYHDIKGRNAFSGILSATQREGGRGA